MFFALKFASQLAIICIFCSSNCAAISPRISNLLVSNMSFSECISSAMDARQPHWCILHSDNLGLGSLTLGSIVFLSLHTHTHFFHSGIRARQIASNAVYSSTALISCLTPCSCSRTTTKTNDHHHKLNINQEELECSLHPLPLRLSWRQIHLPIRLIPRTR